MREERITDAYNSEQPDRAFWWSMHKKPSAKYLACAKAINDPKQFLTTGLP